MQGQNSGERVTPKILLAPTNYLVFELPVSEIIYKSLDFFNFAKVIDNYIAYVVDNMQ